MVIEPENPEVSSEISRIKQKMKDQNDKDRKVYASMFK